MKRICAILLCVLLLASACVSVSAQTNASADQIPVIVDEEFPAAVTAVLLDKAYIEGTERLTTANVQAIIDSCAEELAKEEAALVPVATETVLKHPTLKTRATVECTAEYVYSTYYNQGVKYEWIYDLDGRVQKTVSYEYEERTSEFKTYTYTIVNDDNQSLQKSRVEVEELEYHIHMGDFLFGMATAVLLMMIAVVIVRAIKKM